MFLTFTINVTAGSITLADLGNRTYTTGSYDIGQEFHIDDIRYSSSLAAEIYAGNATATDSLGQSITAQASLTLTEELLNKSGHAQSSDALPQGVNNLYYDDALVAGFISVGPSSTQYLNFNTSTGQLDIKALAITTVNVDTVYTSLANFVAAAYTTTDNYQESDTIILTAATGGTEVWINNGLGTLTVADWTRIESPNLSDSYIRALFTGGDGIAYNNLTGDFDIDLTSTSGLGFTLGQLNIVGDTTTANTIAITSTINGAGIKYNNLAGLTETSEALEINLLSTGGLQFTAVTGTLGIKPDITTGATIAPITIGTNGAGITVDNSSIEHTTGSLHIKADGVNTTHIDWGSGVNQVSASDVPLDTHTWIAIATPSDVQDALQKIDATITSNVLTEGSAINITTGNVIDVLIDNSSIGINGFNELYIKADGIKDSMIDFGTGAGQINTEDVPVTTHTWVAIATPTDVQDALEKLDAEIDGRFSWHLGASSNNAAVTNRFIEREGNTRTNQSPYVLWYACTLKALSLSANAAATWTAEIYKNGVSVATLSSGGAASAFNGALNVSFAAGDKVSMYVTGTNINRPSIDALFSRNP